LSERRIEAWFANELETRYQYKTRDVVSIASLSPDKAAELRGRQWKGKRPDFAALAKEAEEERKKIYGQRD
jgi:hypothetical protein